jgi:hypothetical protein
VVVEHDIAFVSSIADRLVAMDTGRVVAIGPPTEVLADPRVVESYLGAPPASPSTSPPNEFRTVIEPFATERIDLGVLRRNLAKVLFPDGGDTGMSRGWSCLGPDHPCPAVPTNADCLCDVVAGEAPP